MIVLRVSQSMTSQDLSPSRLERARAKLAMLLSERGSAGTGLVAYNGSAHLVLPVTNDSDVVNHMLESLQPDVMPVEGDALSEAISLAAAQNERTGGGGSILVVTDSARTVESDRRVNQSVLFYAILRDASELAGSGISDASKSLEASTQLLTADDADIRKILAQADRSIVDVVSGDATKWRDDGYWFVIPLAICSLAWARRGWSIET
ncbi:MAG: VWA domain-containing protein [Planctomycetota bacterium]